MTDFIYSNQEAFDKVVEHLVIQGKPSYDGSNCSYKSPKGLMCAVGCLLPSRWRVRENLSWGELAKSNSRYRTLGNIAFLEDLQSAHDSHMYSLEGWRKNWYNKMLFIAKNYNLDKSKLVKLATQSWLNKV